MDQKIIAGIAIRTINKPGRADQEIPKHWERFFQQEISKQIPHKVSEDIIALYTDYDGDYSQPYTLIIGYEVSSLEGLPSSLVGKTIPASNYAIYKVEGKFPQSVIETWENIWNFPPARTYVGDMEVYPQDFDPINNGKLEIFIGIQ